MRINDGYRDRRTKPFNVFVINTKRSNDLKSNLERGLGNVVNLDEAFNGKKVLINPHIFSWGTTPYKNNITDFNVLLKLSEISRENGAKGVFVSANPENHVLDMERFYRAIGIMRLMNEKTFYLINLREPQGASIGSPYKFDNFDKEWVVLNVTLPKSHNKFIYGGCLENLALGLTSRIHRMDLFETTIEEGIINANKSFRRHGNVIDIIDGRWGQEGLGPYFGRPVDLGFMIFGTDPVAVDAAGASLTGFNPREIPLLALGERKNIGTIYENFGGDKVVPKRINKSLNWGLKILGWDEEAVAVYFADDQKPIGYRLQYDLSEIDGEHRYSLNGAFMRTFPSETEKNEIMAEMFLLRDMAL